MKLFAIHITNNATAYGGVQPLRQVVLFVFVPFDKNTLGDIIAIRDESGNVVASYKYDAWGNIEYQNGSIMSHAKLHFSFGYARSYLSSLQNDREGRRTNRDCRAPRCSARNDKHCE